MNWTTNVCVTTTRRQEELIKEIKDYENNDNSVSLLYEWSVVYCRSKSLWVKCTLLFVCKALSFVI